MTLRPVWSQLTHVRAGISSLYTVEATCMSSRYDFLNISKFSTDTLAFVVHLCFTNPILDSRDCAQAFVKVIGPLNIANFPRFTFWTIPPAAALTMAVPTR